MAARGETGRGVGLLAGRVGGGMMGRGLGATAGRAVFGGLGGRVAGGLLGSLGGPIGALAGGLLGGMVGSRLLSRAGGGTTAASDPQTQMLANIYRESLRQGQSLRNIQASTAASADAFNRGAFATGQRLRRQGTLITETEAFRSARLSQLQQERSEVNAAIGRRLGGPFETMRILRMGAGNYMRQGFNDLIRGQGTYGAGARIAGRAVTSQGLMGAAAGTYNALAASQVAESVRMNARDISTEGALGGVAARQLFEAQRLGMANVLAAPGTARAGTEGEYQMRVQMQRQRLQQEQAMRYLERIANLLQDLATVGQASNDDVYRARRQAGLDADPYTDWTNRPYGE